MSNEQSNDQAPDQDPIKNVKEEFTRKLSNLEETTTKTLQSLVESNRLLQEKLSTMEPSRSFGAAQANTEGPEDWIGDPDNAAKKLENRIVNRLTQDYTKHLDTQTRSQTQMNQLYSKLSADYPELLVSGSDLYKKANEAFLTLNEQAKTPEAIEAVVLRSAANLGLLPAAKRKQSQGDDFVGGAGRGSSAGGTKIQDQQIEFARLLGRPVDDPKYLERLKQHGKRKDWLRYQ